MIPLSLIRRIYAVPGSEPEMRWAWVTHTLSALVAAGSVVLACNWYFQTKLPRRRECKAALARLGLIVLCCDALGLWFFLSDMSWPAWRLYDALLVGLACYTWWFASGMRGLGLIEERLAQTDALERSSNRYREIAELLPHVVWTAAADGRVDFANRRWREYGLGGRTWLESVHPDERRDVQAWWESAVHACRPVSREVRLEGHEGYRTFVVSATPVANGGSVKWLGACADVEDQKRLAAEKERQARQKTFFLNSLSHDLRAPLNNVVLNAHLLKMTVREDAQLESARVIVENAAAAGELVTKLLDIAKAGEDRSTAEVVNVAGVLRQVARRFQPIAEQKGLWLRVAVDDEHLEALTDRQKLDRVVANLVDNAIKFTDRGGVTLELAGGAGAARVLVSDSGIGVPEGDAPYLFDEFYQVDNHERDRKKGFGMGLAICRSLARQLGGDVRLARTGPGGSCFELTVGGCGPGGGGRPGREARDHAHSEEQGLCRV
jgi:PAS domain S-box-containing protein